MDVIFVAFSNDRQNFLDSLGKEDDEVYRQLSLRAGQSFRIHRDSYATLDRLAEYITLHRDDIRLFLFSGHAGRDRLVLEDQQAAAAGIAHLLAQCPRLQLVFLNGCSSGGQVEKLLELGVPAVISTSAPVGDDIATRFSTHFFRALCQYKSLGESFEMAKSVVLAANSDLNIETRGFAQRSAPLLPDFLWGLDIREEKKQVLDWKLPYQNPEPLPDNFEPNGHLLDVLFEGLHTCDEEIDRFWEQEKSGRPVKLAHKRMAILNALPAPLSQHLVKLLAPSIDDKDEGFNKISEVRLKQIARLFRVLIELASFTLLSQLWECFSGNRKLRVTQAQTGRILEFLRVESGERANYDFAPLIRAIREILDQNEVEYFFEELAQLKDLFYNDPEFARSYSFLQNLYVRTKDRNIEQPEIPGLCFSAEQHLASVLVKTGFIARYHLTSVQGIDVLKYRHQDHARFNHKTVLLRDVLGDLEESEIKLDAPLDNHSILMINQENFRYLSLSPFIFDENAFLDRTDISKLYFFHHYQPEGIYSFQYAAKPEDPLYEVSASRNFGLIKEQFEAFENLLKNHTERIA